jgi:hypothetical protein
MGCPLFVAHKDMVNGIIEHGVVGGHNGPAGIAKDDLYSFADDTFPKYFSTGF